MHYYSKSQKLKEILLGELNGGSLNNNGSFPSILFLAKRYGCSRNTIRKVLAELGDESILPHNIADSVSSHAKKQPGKSGKKNMVIGWFYSGSRDYLVAERTRGIVRFAEENGLDLRIAYDVHGDALTLKLLEKAIDCGIDGVIIANHESQNYRKMLNHLTEIHFPAVIACGQPSDLSKFNIVAEDDFSGTYSMTSYLLKKHDVPAWFLCGGKNCSDRTNGFRQAMLDAGRQNEAGNNVRILNPVMDMPENWNMKEKMTVPGKMIRAFISGLKTPAGIVCANDYIAYGVYNAAKELGLQIGADLFVTGFSDLPFSARLNPPLTTVHVDYEMLGYQAAWLLYQQITGKIQLPVRLLIPSKVQPRSSC